MNIAYDIFIERPELIEFVKDDADTNTFFTEILAFVEGRLKPLEDEINKEEDADENVPMGTIICVMRGDGKFINFAGYSEKLREKMLSSFSKEDMDFIFKKIEILNASGKN